MKTLLSRIFSRAASAGMLLLALMGSHTMSAATSLADQPVFATSEVPGNLALALSVEWPTASRTAHVGTYSSSTEYLGYFDPKKCYAYVENAARNSTNTGDTSYFNPIGFTTSSTVRTCSGAWSGNFLNWAATATIDPFRWAMTGGRRVVDEVGLTILEKGWHSGQGLFDDRTLPANEIAGATPSAASTGVGIRVNGLGFRMQLTTQAPSTGRSMRGEYFQGTATNYKNVNGTPAAIVPNDTADHIWNGAPATGVNASYFSARYTGTFTAPEAGNYYFRTLSDDGVRLYVNDVAYIDNWTDHGTTTDTTVAIPMTAGQTFTLRVEFYQGNGGAQLQLQWRKPSTTNYSTFTSDAVTADYTMRVKVCDPSIGVEANCKRYGNVGSTNWKPEGLIQQYSDKMRFSAFGYLNDSSLNRDGGVLRAAQKFVAPMQPVPGQPAVANSRREWDATTGIFINNPDAPDATATEASFALPAGTIGYSGVMNYLNLFGQLAPGNYKGNDPVSELYYAALRYYRNLGNVASWTNMGTTGTNTKVAWLDGFPAITNWVDPIQHSCQRNFVLGIGDIYTHGDKNVPGNTNTNSEPAMPNLAPDTVNAITATNRVGTLQGIGDDYGTRTNVSAGCCDNNSGLMAGLAFDANTKDIRPDDANVKKTTGKQTVQTYWVDVLEQPFYANNQFYLAAKFGGLDTKKIPSDFDPYTFAGTIPLDWWSTTGETLTDTRSNTTQPRPDNYFAAGRPDALVAGLSKAFASIANAIKSYTTSFSLSTLQVSSLGATSYAAQYDSKDWTGELTASTLTFNENGDPSTAPNWSTKTTFEAQLGSAGWNNNRRVVTWNGSSAGIPFRYDSLTADQQALVKPATYASTRTGPEYVNYLRGDRTYERTATDSSKDFRARTVRLGDIVNAKVTPVAPPALGFSDATNPGYAKFKADWAGRPVMVYVGANDGMLHAFNGALTGATAGTEQFAYVPSFLFAKAETTDSNGLLAQLGNPEYDHKYYVDATPLAFDIDLNNAGGVFTSTNAATSDWRTLLIGGLGKGGKGFYAIDVTDPASMTTEALAAQKVKWEFTAPDMGYSFGAPLVVKTKKYGWVAVFTSGYNAGSTAGHLYIVNPRDGTLLQKISTPTSSDGLAQATAYVNDFSDGTADAVYAGDLDGQIWRFDLTLPRTGTNFSAPVKIAQLRNAAGTAQSVTTQPLIEISPSDRKRYLLVGTGKLLHPNDIQSPSEQSFYAIVDGTAASFGGALPTGLTYPLTRSNLSQVTDVAAGIPVDDPVKVAGNGMGWYTDLGVETSTNVAWRVVNAPTSFSGIVAFSSLQTIGDACSPSGQSRVYAIDFGTGKTALSNLAAYVQSDAAITDLKFLSVDGKTRLVGGDVLGGLTKYGVTIPGGLGLRLLNWREVPTLD